MGAAARRAGLLQPLGAARWLHLVPAGVLVPEDTPAPVRLLGLYDNVRLSHAGRDRVTHPDKRKRWMGVNGGLSSTIFVDGWLEGLWRVETASRWSSSSCGH